MFSKKKQKNIINPLKMWYWCECEKIQIIINPQDFRIIESILTVNKLDATIYIIHLLKKMMTINLK